jgi:hypothetical protein
MILNQPISKNEIDKKIIVKKITKKQKPEST